jgi:hypothetical protein
MCGSGASPTATTSWAGNTSEWSASSPTRSVYSEAHRGKGPDGARARCGSDRLRPPRSKQGVPSLRRRSLAAASEEGFRLKVCQLVEGGVFVWAGGVKAPELVVGSGLPTGHNGRVKIDQYLRVLDHPDIYVVGDVASVVDPHSGMCCPPLAQLRGRRARRRPATSTRS